MNEPRKKVRQYAFDGCVWSNGYSSARKAAIEKCRRTGEPQTVYNRKFYDSDWQVYFTIEFAPDRFGRTVCKWGKHHE